MARTLTFDQLELDHLLFRRLSPSDDVTVHVKYRVKSASGEHIDAMTQLNLNATRQAQANQMWDLATTAVKNIEGIA